MATSEVHGFKGLALPDQKPGLGAVLRDVTELKAAQSALRSANADLQDKHHELEHFVYSVSHDLKSPLVTLTWLHSLMEKAIDAGETNRLRELMAKSRQTADSMRRRIIDLLDVSRMGRVAMDVGPVDLSGVMREVLELHAEEMKSPPIEVRLDQLPVVTGNRERLVQLFGNLLVNAIKYGCDGPTALIEISSRREADRVVVYVRDHGQGIQPQHHSASSASSKGSTLQRMGRGLGWRSSTPCRLKMQAIHVAMALQIGFLTSLD